MMMNVFKVRATSIIINTYFNNTLPFRRHAKNPLLFSHPPLPLLPPLCRPPSTDQLVVDHECHNSAVAKKVHIEFSLKA